MGAFYSHWSELHSGLILSLTVSRLGQKLVLNEENVNTGGHKLKQENAVRGEGECTRRFVSILTRNSVSTSSWTRKTWPRSI